MFHEIEHGCFPLGPLRAANALTSRFFSEDCSALSLLFSEIGNFIFEFIRQSPMSRVRCPSRFTNVVARLNISELVLQQEEVVGGGDGDDVFVRVPRRVQDLLVEVEAVDEDLVALALPGRRYLEERETQRAHYLTNVISCGSFIL